VREWITSNKGGLSAILASAVLLAVLFQFQGCSVYDVVKMPVPSDVQREVGTTPTIPVSEYPDVRREYLERTTRGVEKLDANYSDSVFWADLLASGVELGIDVGSAEAATLPGGALLTTLIAGVGGLMLRKPGDDKRIKQAELKAQLAEQARAEAKRLLEEKIASYKAGRESVTPTN